MSRPLVFHKDLPGPAYVSGRYRIVLAIPGPKSKRLWQVCEGDDVIGHANSLGAARDIAYTYEERVHSRAATAPA